MLRFIRLTNQEYPTYSKLMYTMAMVVIYVDIIIGVGTRGHRGHMPPQLARKGASAPTARAMLVHAVIGLTMKYHIEF